MKHTRSLISRCDLLLRTKLVTASSVLKVIFAYAGRPNLQYSILMFLTVSRPIFYEISFDVTSSGKLKM